MSARHPSPLGEGLVYEDEVPLRFSELEAEIGQARLLSIQERNEEVLRAIAALDEHHGEGGEEDALHHGQELARIESKLDLLLDMVSQMLTAQLAVPPSLPVRLSALGVQWRQSGPLPAAGRRLLLELYLHRKFLRPLILPGRVADVREEEGGGEVTVVFEGMTEAVSNWLEKLIFRQHRRSVALARRQQHE
ncbi:MAG TPA: hypothetical protein ENK48_06145 [Gammaproteobacteria bacterium]|nr:hypothetical protein [Gammaproteobacteria bacterium]